jgi:hypothetical protein
MLPPGFAGPDCALDELDDDELPHALTATATRAITAAVIASLIERIPRLILHLSSLVQPWSDGAPGRADASRLRVAASAAMLTRLSTILSLKKALLGRRQSPTNRL